MYNDENTLQAYFSDRGFIGKIQWLDRNALAACLPENIATLIRNKNLEEIERRKLSFHRSLPLIVRLCSHCQSVDHKAVGCPNTDKPNNGNFLWCRDCGLYHKIEHDSRGQRICPAYTKETPCRFCRSLHQARECPQLR